MQTVEDVEDVIRKRRILNSKVNYDLLQRVKEVASILKKR